MHRQWIIVQKLTIYIILTKSDSFCIHYPHKVEPGCHGVKAHEQKGADSWQTCSDYSTDVQNEQTRILQMTQNNIAD